MANKLYQLRETAMAWNSSGSASDSANPALFTPTSLASGAGRQGQIHDFTTASVGRYFEWRAWIKPGATRVVGEIVEIWLKTSDGSHPDNDDGTADGAVSAIDKMRNLKYLGAIQIDENAAVEMVQSGYVFIPARYACPVFWNATANTLSATAGDYGFSLTPVVDEGQ